MKALYVGNLVMYINQMSNLTKRYGIVLETRGINAKVVWCNIKNKKKIGWYRFDLLEVISESR